MAQVDQSEEYDFVLDSDIQQYMDVAFCTLLVYDILITLDKEVKYFWTRRWCNAITVLFFLIRYIGILSMIALIITGELNIPLNQCNSRNHITKAKVCSHIDFLGKFGIWVTSVGGIFFVTIAYINSNIFKGVIITIAMDYISVARALVLWDNIFKLAVCIKAFVSGSIIIVPFYMNALECVATIKGDIIEKLGFVEWMTQAIIGFIIFLLAFYKAIRDWNLLGSRMAINLKEAGESETKGEFTNHWKPNLKSTLSEPQFAAPADCRISTRWDSL
ncbi:hypothetical protein PNOK_0726900 [Pyrrhoderma noxium]|uniref:DUF6533 domain-containing protein n=1 Tax=Pyrrhoderma noxium TaxID=2282107 RepID=A0A286UCF3_9AGAM|nr:hypothetical protein PNOK_0726900 [Pyrrhoderma noxium]